jgi:hypothetical protein
VAALDLERLDFFVLDLEIDVLLDLVAFDDVGALNILGGLGIDFFVLDAVAGVAVELIEGDALRTRRRRI